MTEQELEKILKTIKEASTETIERVVNGKIRAIDKKLDDYIAKDDEWKSTVIPVVEAYNTASNAGSFVVWLSKVIMAVGVILGLWFTVKK